MGYLFGEPSARTVAHKLMHGVFKLEHTFSSTYGLARESTTNLMDYVSGATLVKHQWDCLFSSGVVIGMFEKEEDGASISDFWAIATLKEDCSVNPLSPVFSTYFAPSGLPVSLPRGYCQTEFSGEIVNALKNKVGFSKKYLTSFKLAGKTYVAISEDGKKFSGYRELLSFRPRDEYYTDIFTIENLKNLKIITGTGQVKEGLTFPILEKHAGNYNAAGPLKLVCKDCGKDDCDGDCKLRCLKCGQYPCICGQICVCFAERFDFKGFFERCDHNRRYEGVGIPFWDKDGKLQIKKYIEPTKSQADIMHNLILDSQGMKLFFLKLDYDAPASPEDVVNTIAIYTKYFEDCGMGGNVVKHFNKLHSAYSTANNISDALMNQDYLRALYEAIRVIPVVDKYIGGIETLFNIAQSQELNASLMNRVSFELAALNKYNPNDPNVQRKRNDLLRVQTFAKKNLDAIKQQNIDSIHERICTCPK